MRFRLSSHRLNKPQSYVSKVEILERRLDMIELMDWLQILEVELTKFLSQ